MHSTELTKEQAQTLSRGIRHSLAYLNRLRTRMEKAPFERNDPLFVLVERAYGAVHSLSVHVHYLACFDWQRRLRK